MTIRSFTSIALAVLCSAVVPAFASTVTLADPQAGGIGYRYTVTMGGLDSATFSNHVGAWSWEDNSLFNAANGEAPVGWTHTSNWVALNVTTTAVFTVRLERDATVPWPSAGDPARLASVASMFPSFTIWKNWDNDLAPQEFADANNDGMPLNDFHTYNNQGAVAWAEDLVYQDHLNNSTLEVIERTYVLTPGNYSIVLGSNAPATDTNRQGYKATFTTTQELPITIVGDAYYTGSAIEPLVVPVALGVLANDTGVAAPEDVVEVTTQPSHGAVTVNADGSFTYTPGQYFGIAGYDVFDYHVLIDNDPNTPTVSTHVVVSTVAAAAGCHVGHIKNEDTDAIAGIVKFDMTATGTWTSAVQHLGKRYAFSGTLSLTGELIQRGQSPLDIEWHLSIHGDGDRHVHAHIHGATDHFGARVNKSPFSVVNPPPSVGVHKVTLAVESSTKGAPQRPGSGLLKVKPNGSAILVGKLGDRTPFLCATALIKGVGTGPVVPVYDGVYRAPGSVSGTLAFGVAANSDAEGSLTVVKPAQTKPKKPGFSITYDATTNAL